MKLPLKARMLQYAIDKGGEFTLAEIKAALEPEYRGESIFSQKILDDYYESFMGVGFFKMTHADFDENGELVVTCVATPDAMSRKKYYK